mmetsp:Transcript_18984/g.55084  ORF Transcript_18984/g.55084 Transcript_18984/m.55084 type:complete len:265 (+) Transcript_18984:1491-2285(+)
MEWQWSSERFPGQLRTRIGPRSRGWVPSSPLLPFLRNRRRRRPHRQQRGTAPRPGRSATPVTPPGARGGGPTKLFFRRLLRRSTILLPRVSPMHSTTKANPCHKREGGEEEWREEDNRPPPPPPIAWPRGTLRPHPPSIRAGRGPSSAPARVPTMATSRRSLFAVLPSRTLSRSGRRRCGRRWRTPPQCTRSARPPVGSHRPPPPHRDSRRRRRRCDAPMPKTSLSSLLLLPRAKGGGRGDGRALCRGRAARTTGARGSARQRG